jgi:hypothetical protein
MPLRGRDVWTIQIQILSFFELEMLLIDWTDLQSHDRRDPFHFGDNKGMVTSLGLKISFDEIEEHREDSPVDEDRSMLKHEEIEDNEEVMRGKEDLKVCSTDNIWSSRVDEEHGDHHDATSQEICAIPSERFEDPKSCLSSASKV